MPKINIFLADGFRGRALHVENPDDLRIGIGGYKPRMVMSQRPDSDDADFDFFRRIHNQTSR